MITVDELDTFQSCRMKWKLSRGDIQIQKTEDLYFSALKKTIFQMYSWLQVRQRIMTQLQVQERWDKNLLAISNDASELSSIAADGWLLLLDYYNKKYTREDVIPLGVNFEFDLIRCDIYYRIHIDLLLSDSDGEIILKQFGDQRKTEWYVYNSFATRFEVAGLLESLKQYPNKKEYIHLALSRPKVSIQHIGIDNDYVESANMAIDHISAAIRSKVFYTSPSEDCYKCKYHKECWW